MAKNASDTQFRAAYAVVGELILITDALDYQLNHVLIEVLPLVGSPMLELVIATLATARKIEILKARSKHIAHPNWRKPLLVYREKFERLIKLRNIACHTPLIPDDTHDAVFIPAAAAKLLKGLQIGDEPTARSIPIGELKSAMAIGESALGEGENLIANFKKANAERIRRFGTIVNRTPNTITIF
jgi:hypothetical protein